MKLQLAGRLLPLLIALLSWQAPAPAQTGGRELGGETLDALLLDPGGKQYGQALKNISRARDQRFIAPLIDLVRFVKTRREFNALTKTLNKLTGDHIDLGLDPHEAYSVWYGMRAELKPPPGYIGWKGELLASRVDKRFKVFLRPGSKSAIRPEEILWGGVKVGGIPSLDDPKTLTADQADYLADADPVFGAAVNGVYRAYPLKILDWHEMSNDVIGGVSVALAYCTLCGSGILYESTQKGHTFRFGSSGLLYRSNKLMFDDLNGSLWSQQTGEPVLGELVGYGIKLKVLPLVVTSWGEWRKRHPDTTVLDVNTGHKRRYAAGAAYGEYFANPGTMFPVWQQSKALAKKERIFALEIKGTPKAYPLSELNRAGGVVNDLIGSTPLTVIYRDAVGRVAIPGEWKRALSKTAIPGVEFANDLDLATIESVLDRKPSLAAAVSAEFLLALPTRARLQLLSQSTSSIALHLALPTRARLQLLHERTAGGRAGGGSKKGLFSAELRNEVVARALIGEVRAYFRGEHEFHRSDQPGSCSTSRGKSGESRNMPSSGLKTRNSRV